MDVTDYVGIVFILIILGASAFVSFYIYVHFSHPLDRDFKGIWIVRVLIVLGMTLAFMMIFILPIDYLSTYKL